jgi:uncharacterized protein (DUF302 family)
MLYKIESKNHLAEIGRAIEAAAQRHKFGVLAIHDMKAKMQEKGVEFEGECLIYEVCNPHQAKKVLQGNLELSAALPCRISVYRAGAGYTLATIRPTALMELFHADALRPVAEEVEGAILAIMQEAAG